MSAISAIFFAPPKGLRRLPPYRPAVGTVCEVSGPNCDDANGYTWAPTTVLWSNDTFVLYGREGYWPSLYKWEHCLFRLSSTGQEAGRG